MVDAASSSLLSTLFLGQARALRVRSPLSADLCQGLGHLLPPALTDLYDRYFRILSTYQSNPAVLLAALHHLALSGMAPELARLYPSCGGHYETGQSHRLAETVVTVLQRHGDEILDFILAKEERSVEVRHSAAVLAGAAAAVKIWGGGITPVELGCRGGLHLLFDQYSYRLASGRRLGQGNVVLDLDAPAQLLEPVGPVGQRYGLDPSPQDLCDPAERRLTESFFAPDETAGLARFRAATALLGQGPAVSIKQGQPAFDLAPLLAEAYQQMAPHNTLFLFSVLTWSRLSEDEQKRVALAVQSLASRLQPHKPMAWLQVEPPAAGGPVLELRLQTFGWADPEDRTVTRLAEAASDLAWLRPLE